jgi:hypothetical protein
VLDLVEITAGWQDGFELDLNPVTVLPEGCWILDAAYTRPRETSTEGHH